MKELKRTKGLYIRCSKEFLELANMAAGEYKSISDLLHEVLAYHCMHKVDPYKFEMMREPFIELCQSVMSTNSEKHTKKVKEDWAHQQWNSLKGDYTRTKAKNKK